MRKRGKWGRVPVEKWRPGYDEVGVALRRPDEWPSVRRVMEEALAAFRA